MKVIQLSRLTLKIPKKKHRLANWPTPYEAMEEYEQQDRKFWGWIARNGKK